MRGRATYNRNDFNRVAMLCALFFLTIFAMRGKEPQYNFQYPNFIYPETVKAGAEEYMNQALAAKQWQDVLPAAMQMAVARERVSRENPEKNVALFADVASKLPLPYSALARLLQANLLTEEYIRNRSRYDERVSSLPLPAELKSWSGSQFRDSISALLTTLTNEILACRQFQINSAGAILKDTDLWQKEGGTIADFMAFNMISMIGSITDQDSRTIPFIIKGEETQKPATNEMQVRGLKLAESAKEACIKDGRMFLASVFMNLELMLANYQEKKEVLGTALQLFGNTPYAAEFIIEKYPGNKEELQKYLDRFPNCIGNIALYNIIANLSEFKVNIKYPKKVVPNSPFICKYDGGNAKKLNILVIELPESISEEYIAQVNMLEHGRVAECIPLKISNQQSDKFKGEIEVDIKKPGRYTLAAAKGKTLQSIFKYENKYSSYPVIEVSQLGVFAFENGNESSAYFYNNENQQPIEGAKIKVIDDDKKLKLWTNLTTDSIGRIPMKEGVWEVRGKWNGSQTSRKIWISESKTSDGRTSLYGDIFPAQPVYSPGEELKFAAVIYELKDRTPKAFENGKVAILLKNTKYEVIDSILATTDKFGRVEGSFDIPKNAPLGDWLITVDSPNKKQYNLAFCYVKVAEFKVPQIQVILESITGGTLAKGDRTEECFQPGDTISIKGRVVRFNGEGFNNLPVNYNILSYGRSFRTQDAFKGTVVTSEDGSFDLQLLTDSLADSPYLNNKFYLSLDAVSPQGEVATTAKGEFYVENIEKSKRRNSKNTETKIFSLNHEEIIVPSGKKSVQIESKSDYADLWYFMVVSDSKSIVSSKWVPSMGKLTKFELPTPPKNDRYTVRLLATHNTPNGVITQEETVTVIPAVQKDTVEVKVESFRDKLLVGSDEKWRFKLLGNGKPLSGTPVIATLYNSALLSLGQLHWSLNPWDDISYPSLGRFSHNYNSMAQGYFSKSIRLKKDTSERSYPQFNTYYWWMFSYADLHGGIYELNDSGVVGYGSGPRGRRNYEAVYEEAVYSDKYVASPMESGANAIEAAFYGGNLKAKNNAPEPQKPTPLRNPEQRLGFFRPMITTDKDGYLNLDFTAPDFVGEWELQIVGYDTQLHTGGFSSKVVSTKPIVARLNLPRFLRMGDSGTLLGSVSNLTDGAQSITVRIEIFNPLDGDIIKAEKFQTEPIPSGGVKEVAIPFTVINPADLWGVRIVAEAGNFSDGEQAGVPILPASTPVTKTAPFSVAPGEKKIEIPIPDSKGLEGKKVSVIYYDNPIWECMKALPTLAKGDTDNPICLSMKLYASATTARIFAQWPEALPYLQKEIKSGKADSVANVLKSLRIVDSELSPWTDSEMSNALTLAQLEEYADTAAVNSRILEIANKLIALQKNDGGWSWFKEMKSSPFITELVLETIGESATKGVKFSTLPKNGGEVGNFIPSNGEVANFTPLRGAIAKAVSYVDSIYVSDSKRIRDYDPIYMVSWLYTRLRLGNPEGSAQFRKLAKRTEGSIRAKWGTLSYPSKCKAAVIMARTGNITLAKEILESVVQFAIADNSGAETFEWHGASSGEGVTVATLVLEALAEIEPSSPHIDAIRRGILQAKMTQVWNNPEPIAATVRAILYSGSEWIETPAEPEIKIGKKSVTITRTGKSPAWGSVVVQGVEPILEVKAASNELLSVTKTVSRLDDSKAPLKVGDKVRVQITLNAKQDVSYVTVLDSRAAGLAPISQVSGYKYQEGVWYFEEVRTAATNFYIEVLRAGTHVLSYDCIIDRPGSYTLGIAQGGSLAQPGVAAHSAGGSILLR